MKTAERYLKKMKDEFLSSLQSGSVLSRNHISILTEDKQDPFITIHIDDWQARVAWETFEEMKPSLEKAKYSKGNTTDYILKYEIRKAISEEYYKLKEKQYVAVSIEKGMGMWRKDNYGYTYFPHAARKWSEQEVLDKQEADPINGWFELEAGHGEFQIGPGDQIIPKYLEERGDIWVIALDSPFFNKYIQFTFSTYYQLIIIEHSQMFHLLDRSQKVVIITSDSYTNIPQDDAND